MGSGKFLKAQSTWPLKQWEDEFSLPNHRRFLQVLKVRSQTDHPLWVAVSARVKC